MSSNLDPKSLPPTGRAIPAAVIFLGMFLFAYSVPLAYPAQPQIAKTLGLEKADDASIVFTSFFFAWLVVIPPFGFLADRFGRKKMLLIGSATLAVGMLLLSFATTVPMACAAQFLNGAGAIILQIVGAAVISDLFAEKRGNALTIAVGLVGIIALASPYLMAQALAHDIAWTQVYRYSAVLPILAFIIQLFCTFPKSTESAALTLREVFELLSRPIFLLMIFAMLVYGIVEQGLPIWAPSFFRDELGATIKRQGEISAFYFIVMSLVRLVIGIFGLFRNVSYPMMIVASAILAAICLAVGTQTENVTIATVFLAALGGAVAMIWPSIMTYAVEVTGKPTTTVFGLVVGIGGSIGVMLGSSALGAMKDGLNLSYGNAIFMMEVPLALLLVVFGGIALTRPAPAKEPPPIIPETPSP